MCYMSIQPYGVHNTFRTSLCHVLAVWFSLQHHLNTSYSCYRRMKQKTRDPDGFISMSIQTQNSSLRGFLYRSKYTLARPRGWTAGVKNSSCHMCCCRQVSPTSAVNSFLNSISYFLLFVADNWISKSWLQGVYISRKFVFKPPTATHWFNTH